MGVAIATAALELGHEVDLVTGPVDIASPAGARVHPVTTALEMLEACARLHPTCDVLIGAAAVSDYRPRQLFSRKRPRDDSSWTLDLEPNPDILAELGAHKGERTHIGFALESRDGDEVAAGLQRARRKIERKNLDWCVLNFTDAIGAKTGEFFLIPRVGDAQELGRCSKRELAERMVGVLLSPQ